MIEAMGRLVGKRAAALVAGLVEERGAAALRSMTVEELEAAGLARAAATKVRALVDVASEIHDARLRRGDAFRSSRDVARGYAHLRELRTEQFHALLLDGKHRVIRDVLVSQGTLTSSPVHPREVFGPAIREAAAAVVFVHNHPSGDPTPSVDDIEVTRRLREVGELVGILVLDHVVIGDGTHVSLADRGLL